jgi:hypothetical protein
MGGSGSGKRWHYGVKSTTAEYATVDVRELERAGALLPYIRSTLLWRRWDDSIESVEILAAQDAVTLTHGSGKYAIYLERTDCNFGGSRIWFRCPATNCGQRVAVLYKSTIFACRHCLQLAYTSSREDAGGRAIGRADRLRKRLAWEPGIANGVGDKPKWMRWRTYDRLVAEHTEMAARYVNARARTFGWEGTHIKTL